MMISHTHPLRVALQASSFPEGRIYSKLLNTYVPKLSELVERAVNETCISAKAGVVGRELSEGRVLLSIPWAEKGRKIISSGGPRLIRSAFEDSATANALSMEKRFIKAAVPLHLDVMNPRALAGLTQAQQAFLTSLEQYQQQSILELVRAGAAQGWSQRWLSWILLDSRGFGLDPRSLRALLNYAKGQRALGVASDVLLKRLRARGRKLLKQRADMIAEWLTSKANTAGFHESWAQGREAGVISEKLVALWVSQEDERVCDECEDVDGEEIHMGEVFSNNTDGPPIHIHDRCYLALVEPEKRR